MWYYLAKSATYRPTKNNLTTDEIFPELEDKMVDAYVNQGLSINEIARRFNYDPNLTRNLLLSKGVNLKSDKSERTQTSIQLFKQKAEELIKNNLDFCKNIVERFKKGESVQRISVDEGLSSITVNEIIKKITGNPINIKIDPKDIQYAVQLFRLGKNPNYIARQTGISPQKIISVIIKNLSIEERERYRESILKNDPILRKKVESVLDLIKKNPQGTRFDPKSKKGYISKTLGIDLREVIKIINMFAD